MRTFKEYIELRENVKEKTNLTRFLQSIKSSQGRDPTTWLVLADFLQEQEDTLDQDLAEFIRKCLDIQRLDAERDFEKGQKLSVESLELGRKISEQFKKLGYSHTEQFGNQIVTPKNLIQKQIRPEVGVNPEKMSLSVRNSTRLTPLSSTHRPNVSHSYNNVAFHDLADRTMQLYTIFIMAQRLATSLFQIYTRKDDCKDYSPRWLRGRIGDIRRGRIPLTPNEVLAVMRQTWQCCEKWKPDAIFEVATGTMNDLVEWLEVRTNDHDMDQVAVLNILQDWQYALRKFGETTLGSKKAEKEAAQMKAATDYREEISRIIKNHRNENSIRRTLHWRD